MTEILKDILLSAFPGRSYGEGALDGMAEAPQVFDCAAEAPLQGDEAAGARVAGGSVAATTPARANQFSCGGCGELPMPEQSTAGLLPSGTGTMTHPLRNEQPPAGTIFTGVAAGEAGAVTRRAAPEFLEEVMPTESRNAIRLSAKVASPELATGLASVQPEFLTLTERCLMVADRTLAESRAK